jgi:hypothetical protein
VDCYDLVVKVVGLYLVRNEVDIIEINLKHHLADAIDEAVVVDNGSIDGTLEALLDLAEDLPLLVTSEPGPYKQGELLTRMARYAASRGADWVLPIDADEFWVGADQSMRTALARCPADVGVLRCQVLNFVQRREEVAPGPSSLLGVTMRTPNRLGHGDQDEDLVEANEIGFVEIDYPSKCVSRSSPGIFIGSGNHSVEGTGGTEETTEEVVCLHVPLRARSILTVKVDHGRRIEEAVPNPNVGWHVRRWWRLARQGGIDSEWEACSHRDGHLTVKGIRRPLVHDDRIRRLVEPLVMSCRARPLPRFHDFEPAVGAYLLALTSVPGSLTQLDFSLLVELNRLQREAGIRGDMLTVGAGEEKTAILLGYLLGDHERLFAGDLGGALGQVDGAARTENDGQRAGDEFVRQYLRFHLETPIFVDLSSPQTGNVVAPRTCRIVHFGPGSADSRIAASALTPGGIAVIGDRSPMSGFGSALDAPELLTPMTVRPVCRTDTKVYFATELGPVGWDDALAEWAEAQVDLKVEMHDIAGRNVPWLIPMPGRVNPPAQVGFTLPTA